MARRIRIEVFSAGCPLCEDVIWKLHSIASNNCDIGILDMNHPWNVEKADKLGIHRIPAVLIDGELLDRCVLDDLNEELLIATGIADPVLT